MCAKPGKLLASLASPPLVSSWWIAVVLATPPVVTTGTARSRVLLLVPTELRTGPWGFPQTAWVLPVLAAVEGKLGALVTIS